MSFFPKLPMIPIALCFIGNYLCANETPLGAFSLSLEELLNIKTSTVSRVDESVDNAPGTVHIITHEMMKRRGYTSLRDVLQIIPGVSVLHRDLQYVAAFRGLAANDNEKFTLLINGNELNGIHEPDFINGPINLETLDRVEIIVGPSSIFQPANTLVATVNLITRKVKGGEFVVASGTERKYSLSGSGGNEFDNGLKIASSKKTVGRFGLRQLSHRMIQCDLKVFEGLKTIGFSGSQIYFSV